MGGGSEHGIVTAIVVDDDPLVRQVVRSTLERAAISVLGEGATGLDAIELAARLRPDVVLLDIVMPQMDGIAATKRIVADAPEQTVILLTGANDDDLVVLGLRAGAAGFLTKDLRIEALPRAVAGAPRGEPAISRSTAMRLIEQLRRVPVGAAGMRPVASQLTEREWEVLDLLNERLTNDEIARRLVVSGETVRTHVKHILRKLEVSSRTEAVSRANELRSGVPQRATGAQASAPNPEAG